MDDYEHLRTPTKMASEMEDMQLKNGVLSHDAVDRIRAHEIKEEMGSRSSSPKTASSNSSTHSSLQSRPVKGDHEETVGGDVILKHEPGHPPKLTRTSSQKIISRAAPLFTAYADKTGESKDTFTVIPGCIYSNKSIGSTEQAMECDCAEEWDSSLNANVACGEDSDCINRATKMECFGDCGCGSDCQNQRFQRRQYANVAVIQTEKKGYGLRADDDLQAHDFIFEYVGEVINENHFRRRMIQYDEEGIKHFYFMSLSKGEFVDATIKGNLGRFCNHSCNPNCYVDKWVVGDKLRMGIFAERNIKAGEELVFNYNVDRYGANPQPCYCGEPNCTGFIGGKTQTERATKLSNLTIEALGIDDGDGWDTAVAKKPRKKKAGEDDEEYVNNVQPKSLDEDGVTKVMATLLQCKEKWIAVKLLSRIQRCDNERVRNRVVKMHGYQILNSTLALWKDDFNVVLQTLDILDQFPRLTRNKISDSKIESTIESLKSCGDERVESQSIALLKEWSVLEVGYRIPRKKRDIHSTNTPDSKPDHFGRRDTSREDRRARSRSPSETKSRSRSRSIDAPRAPSAPSGPRIGVPQRNATFYATSRPPYRPRPFNALPSGWFAAISNGSTYFYSATGQTTWTRPTVPAAQPPPPPKPVSNTKALEDIINNITNAKANTPKDKISNPATLQLSKNEAKGDKKDGKEKWRSYSEEKQKKLYENTLFPHIKYVMDKFKTKLPREDLKRFAKDISKKLVNSDFKNNRVENPTRISSRQEKQVKKHVKEFFDKAVAKKREYDKKKVERKGSEADATKSVRLTAEIEVDKKEEESDGDPGLDVSDDDTEMQKPESETPVTPNDQVIGGDGLKRKREDTNGSHMAKSEDDATPSKRLRSETPPPPPPPPPPPTDSRPLDQSPDSDQPMTDNPVEADCAQSETQGFSTTTYDLPDDTTPTKPSLTMDLDPTPHSLHHHHPSPPPPNHHHHHHHPSHPSFHIARPTSEPADTSDSAPSPSLLPEASDLTPVESEGEGFGRRELSYTGLDLKGVRELEVRDGS